MTIQGREIEIKENKITVDGKQMIFGTAKNEKFFSTSEYSLLCNVGLALQLEADVPTALPVSNVARREDSSRVCYSFSPRSETAIRENYRDVEVYLSK